MLSYLYMPSVQHSAGSYSILIKSYSSSVNCGMNQIYLASPDDYIKSSNLPDERVRQMGQITGMYVIALYS